MSENLQNSSLVQRTKVHLFTSFVVYDDCPESVIDFYTKKLIPQWVKVHLKFFKSVNIVTNISNRLKNIDFLNICEISLLEAFCNYDYDDLNVTGSQLGSWIHFINSIPDGDVAVYLDPDAFMLSNKLQLIAPKVESCQLTRIVSPGRMCDAGVAILKNNITTRKILLELSSILSNKRVVNHIEVSYQDKFKDNKDFFIKWTNHSLLLRGELCGILPQPDTIHDCTELSNYNLHLDKDSSIMIELIKEKKYHRSNYLPEKQPSH